MSEGTGSIRNMSLVELATTPAEGNPKTIGKLVARIVTRRNWALHRHVHLVAAFAAARAESDVKDVLSVGCGAGLSELFLAASNPDVHFTLSDFDLIRLARAQEVGSAWGIDNVTYRELDLLAAPDPVQYDFVSSIEVLEHIEDDLTAASNLLKRSRHYAYILVPFCSEVEAENPRRQRHVWERDGHYRPGYTHERFGEILKRTDTRFVRNTYFMPEGYEFRERLKALSNDAVRENPISLMAEAAMDVQDRVVSGGTLEAQGIEALVSVIPR